MDLEITATTELRLTLDQSFSLQVLSWGTEQLWAYLADMGLAPEVGKPIDNGMADEWSGTPLQYRVAAGDRFLTSAPTLHEYLQEQIPLNLTQRQGQLVRAIIDALDSDGYLRVPLERVAPAVPSELDEALRLVQSMEPAGVGARSVGECLRLQLAAQGRLTPLLEAVVTRYLDLLAARRFRDIARRLGVDREAVQAALAVIQTLKPHPGQGFASPGSDSGRRLADFVFERDQGTWSGIRVTVTDYAAPTFVGPALPLPPKQRDILRRALERRRILLERLGSYLATVQARFILEGTAYQERLSMDQAAHALGTHPSTISRAVRHKWAQVPWALLPLTAFFVTGIPGLAERLRDIVRSEDPARPLSDAELVQRLAQQGCLVSRRTVVKYRQKLGIPPTYRRRSVR